MFQVKISACKRDTLFLKGTAGGEGMWHVRKEAGVAKSSCLEVSLMVSSGWKTTGGVGDNFQVSFDALTFSWSLLCASCIRDCVVHTSRQLWHSSFCVTAG